MLRTDTTFCNSWSVSSTGAGAWSGFARRRIPQSLASWHPVHSLPALTCYTVMIVSAVSLLSQWLGVGRSNALVGYRLDPRSPLSGCCVDGGDTRVSALTLAYACTRHADQATVNPPSGSWVCGWRVLFPPVSQTRKLRPREGKSLPRAAQHQGTKASTLTHGEGLSLPP